MNNLIKRQLKSIVPNSALQFLKMGLAAPRYKKIADDIELGLVQCGCYLFGTPIHGNLGDHLITLGTRRLLEDTVHGDNIIEIPMEVYRLYWTKLVSGIPHDALILINGGGWMGDVWPEDELTVQHIISHFPNNRIIILPQTIYYSRNMANSDTLIDSGVGVYCSHQNFVMSVREINSFNLARDLYPGLDVRLIPDMALAYINDVPKNRHQCHSTVGVCMRSDREAFVSHDDTEAVQRIIRASGKTIKRISTVTSRIPDARRKEAVDRFCQTLCECDLVITDRLHGMVFSYITDTPCVAFDNATHKVSGLYDSWLSDSKTILPLFTGLNQPRTEMLTDFIKRPPDGANHFNERNFQLLKGLLADG